MYLTDAFFKLNSFEADVAVLRHHLNEIIDQWRYNGQIIGREITLCLVDYESDDEENENDENDTVAELPAPYPSPAFVIRVNCPEQESLAPQFNNASVTQAIESAQKCGLIFDSFQILAEDLNSDTTTTNSMPNWQVLYTTYLQSCSPLHSGDDLAPIPLYRQLQAQPHLAQDVIKWQENWQAYDQLQMNAAALEQQAVQQLSEPNSSLSKHGRYLARAIEMQTGIPTYYYLYRTGGESLSTEQKRRCPSCGQAWALAAPLFEVFYFKCDDCRLVSNLSWHFCE